MADEKQEEIAIEVTITHGVLLIKVPLMTADGDLSKSKIQTYGALKLGEEQASIYFMNKAIERRQKQLLRPTDARPFTPGVH